MMCLLTGACGRPQTDVFRLQTSPLRLNTRPAQAGEGKETCYTSREPQELQQKRFQCYLTCLHFYTFGALPPSLPGRVCHAHHRIRPVVVGRATLPREALRGPVRQLLGSQPSRPARRARSRAATDLAGWSARSRPRKSQLRLRKRLVSAVQSRHSREGQKCDPGATLRLEKAGPPR